jgi:uncharacterized protein YybS (DUF2232 family)
MDKIELIERSMRACFFGIPGIVPFLGTPFAFAAMVNSSRIKRRAGTQWNPAHRYLFWGMVCARIGTSLTIVIAILVTAVLILDSLT